MRNYFLEIHVFIVTNYFIVETNGSCVFGAFTLEEICLSCECNRRRPVQRINSIVKLIDSERVKNPVGSGLNIPDHLIRIESDKMNVHRSTCKVFAHFDCALDDFIRLLLSDLFVVFRKIGVSFDDVVKIDGELSVKTFVSCDPLVRLEQPLEFVEPAFDVIDTGER